MSFLLIYALILLAVFLLQRKLLYFPANFTEEQHGQLLAELNLQPWPSANNLQGLISKSSLTAAKGTVLVFHGNAGAALHRTYYIEALQRLGFRVIVAEYPGYGVRSGSPSEAALVEDGIATAKLALYECEYSTGSSRWLRVTAKSRILSTRLVDYSTLKSSSGSSGFCSSMYFFHTSSVTFPLDATQ